MLAQPQRVHHRHLRIGVGAIPADSEDMRHHRLFLGGERGRIGGVDDADAVYAERLIKDGGASGVAEFGLHLVGGVIEERRVLLSVDELRFEAAALAGGG